LIIEKYNQMIDLILNSSPPKKNDKSLHRVLLSAEVKQARRGFHNKIELMMLTGKEFEDVRDIASKAVSQTVKMAHILHIANNPELLNQLESSIDIDTWNKAQELGEFHLNESVQVQRSAFENKDVAYAKKILLWIVTSRLIQQNVRPKSNKIKVESALTLLCDYGYLHSLESVYAVNTEIS